MRPSWAWAMTSIFMASNTLSWAQSSISDTCWWSSLQRGCWLTCRLASMSAPCWFCGDFATASWRHVPASLAQPSPASFWVFWKQEYCQHASWLRQGGIGARSSLSVLHYGLAPFQEWVSETRPKVWINEDSSFTAPDNRSFEASWPMQLVVSRWNCQYGSYERKKTELSPLVYFWFFLVNLKLQRKVSNMDMASFCFWSTVEPQFWLGLSFWKYFRTITTMPGSS